MKKLGILIIAIALAFVLGIITANPGAEGVSGWQAAIIEINGDISDILEFLENEVVSIENQDVNCVNGQVPKRDSESPTGWICADDDTGDGGGGGLGGPFDEMKLKPQSFPPTECNLENRGIIYYQDNSGGEDDDQVCVCSEFESTGTYDYLDLIGQGEC